MHRRPVAVDDKSKREQNFNAQKHLEKDQYILF